MSVIDRSLCGARRHGRYWCYDKLRCRCPDARAEHLQRRKHMRAGTLPPGYIDATGTRRRLQALAAEGWTAIKLAELTGLSERALYYIIWQRTRVQVGTARAVARVYDRIAGHDGGSRVSSCHALRQGWPDSYAWPDHAIDNPTAQPWFGEDAAAVDRAEAEREARRMFAAGAIHENVRAATGLPVRAIRAIYHTITTAAKLAA